MGSAGCEVFRNRYYGGGTLYQFFRLLALCYDATCFGDHYGSVGSLGELFHKEGLAGNTNKMINDFVFHITLGS